MSTLDLDVHLEGNSIMVASLTVRPQLLKKIQMLQQKDSRLRGFMRKLDSKQDFWIRQDGILVFKGRVSYPTKRG